MRYRLTEKVRLLVEMSSTIPEKERLFLSNPQTSGDFLIVIPYERRARYQIKAQKLLIVLVRSKREQGRSS